ncbi:hypothetical protein JCM33374_g653 [Metschnikowia sp. JCM 33374]|nr:hypothetical protein JCM33374_g653 [Metschnikowia sp. JCM 33374]
MVAVSSARQTGPQYLHITDQGCKDSSKLESSVKISFSGSEDTPPQRKQHALKILDFYKEWSGEYPHRQSFQARYGSLTGFMWVGSMVQNSGFQNNVLPDVIDHIQHNGMPEEIYYEFSHENAMQGFGIILTTRGSQKAQKAVKSWSAGQSYTEANSTKPSNVVAICYSPHNKRKPESNDVEAGKCNFNRLEANKPPAGNVHEYLRAFNPGIDLGGMVTEQPYCYSEGISPDFRPPPNANKTCATHYIRKGDTCRILMARYWPLKEADIEQFNRNTYGWRGCGHLIPQQPICVSGGTPPRPNPSPNAECGPLAPGDLYDAECRNNVCCSDNGFCGVTPAFCQVTPEIGPPGTNGCYSNCGYGHLPTVRPSSFKKAAYWLDTDGGLHMPVAEIHGFDTVHYAYAKITKNSSIEVGRQFGDFLKSSGARRVVSFGGWHFSSSPSTYNIMRQAVSEKYREVFARNVLQFVNSNGSDGVDFDWQYPEATDIPNIPQGNATDGHMYAQLLKHIKDLLPEKTVSVAIPPLYGYLKGFPLKQLDGVVDYFNLMAHDYVGQWDYGRPHTGIGCHNDRASTERAMKMIVKSGIDTTKVYGGLANYGRTFKSADKACTSYKCPFQGPYAKTAAGDVTDTPGFLSIGEINQSRFSESKFNESSKCFYGVYNNKEDWVAWMKQSDIRYTEEWYKKDVGLGGSVLWLLNYNKPSFSEFEDNIQCYKSATTLQCDGTNMYFYPDQSQKRDQNKINSLDAIFGVEYPELLKARRLLSYLYVVVETQGLGNASKSSADYITGVRKCSRQIFTGIQRHFYTYTSEEQMDLKSSAYLVNGNAKSMESDAYAESMAWLDARGPRALAKFRKLCNPSFAETLSTYRNQLAPAQAKSFGKMMHASLDLYNNITKSDEPSLAFVEPNRYYGRLESETFQDNWNQLSEQIPSDDEWQLSNYIPDTILGRDITYPNGMSPSEYEEEAFDKLTSVNVSSRLSGMCLHEGEAQEYDDCVRRMGNSIFSDATISHVHTSNTNQELGSPNAPSYVVNMAGNSIGSACNALSYFLSAKGGLQVTKSGMWYLTRQDSKHRAFLRKYSTCMDANVSEKHEFPPATTKEGVRWENGYRIHTASVTCLPSDQNSAEVTSFQRFYDASVNQSMDELEYSVDWSRVIPSFKNTPMEWEKRGPVEMGQKFYVTVNIGSDCDCSLWQKIPKIKLKNGWGKRRNGVWMKDTTGGGED